MRHLLTAALAITGLTGCASLQTLGPRSAAVALVAANLPDGFVATNQLSRANFTPDPLLNDLLARVPNTPDVSISAARLAEARARLAAARAGLLPRVQGSASLAGSDGDNASSINSGSLGIGLDVPLDFFGTNRTRTSAAQARAEEAAFNQDRVSALTRATLNDLYVALRTAQNQTSVTMESLDSANDTLSLATSRQRAGLETGLGVAQATSNRDAIAARLPSFAQAEIAARLGLEALLGDLPHAQLERLSPKGQIPRFDLARADVAPAQWVRMRADITAAGRRLTAAGLNARAAQLDRYPTVSLDGLINGSEASRGPTGIIGSLSANLLSTLFDFGRLQALANAADALAQVEARLYRQLVLNALAQVETQASAVRRGQDALIAQSANVASARDQAQLARVRYTSGLSSFLDVLTAERGAYDAQSAQVAATGETARAEVGLILALGY